jgi:hypothetical protein
MDSLLVEEPMTTCPPHCLLDMNPDVPTLLHLAAVDLARVLTERDLRALDRIARRLDLTVAQAPARGDTTADVLERWSEVRWQAASLLLAAAFVRGGERPLAERHLVVSPSGRCWMTGKVAQKGTA